MTNIAQLFSSLTIIVAIVLMPLLLKAQGSAGIGAMLKLDTLSDNSTLPKIQSVVDNSPAAAQMKAGLYIISVNGNDTRNQSLEQVVNMIRGAAGTKVKLTVADNAKGKQPKEVELSRVEIRVADPIESFNALCEAEVKRLKRSGKEVVRTQSSECGDFYFNFDAEAGTYHVRILTLNDKPTTSVSASVAEMENDKLAVRLKEINPTTLEGEIHLTKPSVGVISTILTDKANCKSMYVIVYR